MSNILYTIGLKLRNIRLTARLKFSHFIMNGSEKISLRALNMDNITSN